jgi:hypothetical protein
MASLSDFDMDLAFGQEGESLVKELLTGGQTIEVKRDKRWKETGNVYVETECYFNRTQSWGPSGINVTKAAYWAFVLEEMVLLIPIEALRYAVDEFGSSIACNIPPNPSKGVLLTVPQLLKSIKEYKNADLG